MKYLLIALPILSLGAFAAEDLNDLKVNARSSIDREMRALRSSKSCIDSSRTVKDYKNCNYHPENFNSERQEEQEQPDSATSSESIQTHGP